VALDEEHPDRVAAALRTSDPAVAVRIEGGRVLLDVLALSGADLDALPELVRRARS
jgi:hypothetical protein